MLLVSYLWHQSCVAKVIQLDIELVIHQNIRGLNISVNYTSRVELKQDAKHIVKDLLYLIFFERFLGYQGLKILRELLEYEVQVVLWAHPCVGKE